MTNVMDNLDTYLTATAKFARWRGEFEEKYYGPLGEVLYGLMTDKLKQNNKKDANKTYEKRGK